MKDTPLELIVSDRGRVSVTFEGKVIPATSVEIIHDSDGLNNHAIITIPMKIIRVGSKRDVFTEWKGSPIGNGWLKHPATYQIAEFKLRDGTIGSPDRLGEWRWNWISDYKELYSFCDVVGYRLK